MLKTPKRHRNVDSKYINESLLIQSGTSLLETYNHSTHSNGTFFPIYGENGLENTKNKLRN